MQTKKFVFNPFSENTYVVYDQTSKEAIVIDPGCFDDDEKKELEYFIRSNNLTVKYLVNTHCHIDHILGNKFVKEIFAPIFLAPELDIPLLHDAEKQANMFGLSIENSPEPEELITENKIYKIGKIEFNFLFTPGHTPGEYCVYFESQKKCFTGDVLFKQGIGRTDLWGGDFDTLISSIEKKLLSLPDSVEIYPGHGNTSKIGLEKLENPFLKS